MVETYGIALSLAHVGLHSLGATLVPPIGSAHLVRPLNRRQRFCVGARSHPQSMGP